MSRILCNLTAEELRKRQNTILEDIRKVTLAVHEIPHGYAYTFIPDSANLLTISHLVDLERQCCQFLTFKIIVEPAEAIRLEITGPPEAHSVIADYFGGTKSVQI
jgi:hypothetical protein